MSRTEMEKSVKLLAPQLIEKPGKIYVKDNLLFIGEMHRGVHVFDNTNPRNPENIGFIQIDGSVDIAIKGDVLYADNAVDLISIKLKSNLTSIEVVNRIRNVFPELTSPDQMPMMQSIANKRPPNSVIVDWKLIEN
jgi:hypothetical protein